MQTATLRKSGGSVVVSIPKSALEQLGLTADMPVEIAVEGDRIMIRRKRRGRIGMTARLALCDFSLPASPEETEWADVSPVGREFGSPDENVG
jgi:antitoxin ChpS